MVWGGRVEVCFLPSWLCSAFTFHSNEHYYLLVESGCAPCTAALRQVVATWQDFALATPHSLLIILAVWSLFALSQAEYARDGTAASVASEHPSVRTVSLPLWPKSLFVSLFGRPPVPL